MDEDQNESQKAIDEMVSLNQEMGLYDSDTLAVNPLRKE